METRPSFEQCPRCRSSQPVLEMDEGGVSVRRCRTCGFPLGQGLTLESGPTQEAGPPGEPSAEGAPAPAGPPRPAMDFAVPVRSATFTFRTVDGASFEGTLSLHLNAENHPGTETVLDRLNDPNMFLPLRVPGDLPVVFLNKIRIVRVDVSDEEVTPVDPENAGDTNIQPVKVELVNGERLHGTVRIDGPSGRRRLSDFLNTQLAFLPLVGPERVHLLHKRFIARIEPQRSK
jgi:hypothetical protein